ncbi:MULTISPECIES: ABC transporter substrate-binding protein [Acinetobacter]|uniref:ABC transporter substrate-binding protein n=1 Tax=Acinetobacter TaxID=469 RepID=UPI000B3C9825|nr:MULTISPECIES: ABC transporter substrate-binding protein [Acinetobacter]AXY59613.1 ABC transporter substrate-binding protein [Acinetobacter sp. WCHAc010052]WOE42627.1 ABC transporter substrate-binding protein [Acinetobacter chinensis]
MNTLEKTDIQLGYIPLLDCTAILWAQHQGYFKAQGLNVTLVKEASWTSLRDRLAFDILDAAHCLSAMLPAAAIGEDQLGIPLQTSLVLSTNRAFISLSQKLCWDLDISEHDSPAESATKLKTAIQSGQKVRLAHVFKHSIHHYCLREWLALADEQFAESYPLSTLPPPYMVDAISTQLIDGFCVGEPWNIHAQIQGYSQVIADSKQIIPEVADKVLAVTQEWVKKHPHTLKAVETAIQMAQQDLQTFDSLDEVWQMLEDSNIIRFKCSPWIHTDKFNKIQDIIRSFGLQKNIKSSDFEWILLQMCKWDNRQLEAEQIQKIANQCTGITIQS